MWRWIPTRRRQGHAAPAKQCQPPSEPEEAGRAPHRTSGGPQGDMAPWHFFPGLLATRTTSKERINSCCFTPKKKKKLSLSYRGSKSFNPKSLLHLFFAGLERTPFCSWYIIFFNHKILRARETFLDAIQDRSSENHLGQKNSTRLEGKVTVLCSRHFSSDFPYKQ